MPLFLVGRKSAHSPKVLALVILILWTALLFRFNLGRLGLILILALLFGLLGDLLLLFPDRCFKWGLGAFLLGHFTYLYLAYVLIQLGCAEGKVASITPWAWAGGGGCDSGDVTHLQPGDHPQR